VTTREAAGDKALVEKSPTARRALLQAAQRLFVDRGYRGTSVIDIVELAGASVGTLYYHFGSKADLYLQTWADYQAGQERRAKEAVAAARAAGEHNGLRLYLAGTKAYLKGAWANREIVRMTADGDTPPGFQGLARQANQKWVRQNKTLLRSDDPVTTRVLVAIVTDSIGGICREVAACQTRAEAGQVIDRALEVFAQIGMADRRLAEEGPPGDRQHAVVAAASSLPEHSG
jgi:AcrR family transcriptional regulator